MKHILTLLTAPLLAPLAALPAAEPAQPPAKPNLLIILADDMGYSDLGCMGGDAETPHLDALAKSGILFPNFHNEAKCAPSRASLMTGLTCQRTGADHKAGDATRGAMTIAEALKGNYTTLMVGKWHIKPNPLELGFQRYFGAPLSAIHWWPTDKKEAAKIRLDGRTYTEKDMTVPVEKWFMETEHANYAIKFLQEEVVSKGKGKPFFMYYASHLPHWPLQAPRADVGATVCNTPMRGYKSSLWEGGMGTPMIFHWPEGIDRPGILSQQVGHLYDIFPTVLDMAGLSYPTEYAGRKLHALDGQSLLPQIKAGAAVERTLCWQYEKYSAGLQGKWKALRQTSRGKEPTDSAWQLYDLSKDRSETIDVAQSNPEVVQTLSKIWDDWYRDISGEGGAPKGAKAKKEKEPRKKEQFFTREGLI